MTKGKCSTCKKDPLYSGYRCIACHRDYQRKWMTENRVRTRNRRHIRQLGQMLGLDMDELNKLLRKGGNK